MALGKNGLPFTQDSVKFAPTLALPLALALAPSLAGADQVGADDPAFTALDHRLTHTIRPLLEKYCYGCHNADRQKGDLDLESIDSVAAARRHTTTWEKTLDQIALGEMPPDDEIQPTPAEKNLLMHWAREFLEAEGRASAGDPGRVVLRRLNNTEYTLTLRDLTGAPLDPAREFPVDGAAGEGFVNVGEALAMSPALFDKYLAAAKQVAGHAVLLPEGIRFSVSDRRGDWADEVVGRIRSLYARYSDDSGATAINLQGIALDTNAGGRLPVEKYLEAASHLRADLSEADPPPTPAAAHAHGLNPKYFATLWEALHQPAPSALIARVASQWRSVPAAEVAAEIARWQGALTRFQTVGHVKPWMVANDPLQPSQAIRVDLPAAPSGDSVTVYLAATDAGDGSQGDAVVWELPRLVLPGRPDLLIRDVRGVAATLATARHQLFSRAADFLAAADEAATSEPPAETAALAARHGLDRHHLAAWLDAMGISDQAPPQLDYFTTHLDPPAGYPFVHGWGKAETPNIIANASDQHVRVPGNLRGGGVAVHPSPDRAAAVGWRSPLTGHLDLTAMITHAHPECGNGVTWSLELRRGHTRQRLAAGYAHGQNPVTADPIEKLSVREGDLISLIVGPRDGNHACDLTDIELVLRDAVGGREWSLTRDVASDLLAANPHADGFGRADAWHFYTEPVAAGSGTVVPGGSVLARWLAAATPAERQSLAHEVQVLMTGDHTPDAGSPDAELKQWLGSLHGPLLSRLPLEAAPPADHSPSPWGLDPDLFDATGSLRLPGLSLVPITLPADLVAGCAFVTTASLADPQGSLQIAVTLEPPTSLSPGLRSDAPILVHDNSPARDRFLRAFADFRALFPAALCYTKIIPVDEVITLTVYHREDEPFIRLMLDEAEHAELDRLWAELRFIGQDALTMVDAYDQLLEYASQDSDPSLFHHLREPILQRADDFRRTLTAAEPTHLDALVDLADRAYRRPITTHERESILQLYHSLRAQELNHEDAVRLALARVLAAPAFLYRIEEPANGPDPQPVNPWELANRLSYFLWSSMPDATLRTLADNGTLTEPSVLRDQARRLLLDPRARALATEFACQWLHIREFDQLDEKSERHFPEFVDLRGPMYEESILFFTDLFQSDGSIMGIVDADHTFLNETLAAHYGIPGITGPEWRRVTGIKAHGRGGVLGMATTLAKHSGASRTSPILRGNWLVEVLLGDKLPKPPAGVPPLPEAEDDGHLTMRQITERHSSDPNCSGCHARIDPYGFALERFDAIGRLRDFDLGGRPIDTTVSLPSGVIIDGAAGLRHHLTTTRQDEFLRSFCRKLLGYALARGLQLSDQPLVASMVDALRNHDFRFTAALDRLLESPQFLRQRGLDATHAEEIR